MEQIIIVFSAIGLVVSLVAVIIIIFAIHEFIFDTHYHIKQKVHLCRYDVRCIAEDIVNEKLNSVNIKKEKK